MRKPYCKMSIKDLLDALNSMNTDQGEEVQQPVQRPETVSILPLHTFQRTQIDPEVHEMLVLHGGRHLPGNN
jgi:hypothetical protein